MKRIIAVGVLAALGGCVSYDEGRVGPLGSTVYLSEYLQIVDKQKAANPGTGLAAEGVEGPLTEKVMEGYRGTTGDATQVAQPIQINVNN
jgi:hypothetical protein